MEKNIILTADQLRETGIKIFHACGVPAGDALIVVDHLVNTSLMGIDSHGVMRIPQYVDNILEGKIKPGAQVRIIKESHSTAIIDCGFNFGQVGAKFMAETVCKKARSADIACVVSENCNHIGRLGAYTQEIAENDLVGIGLSNSSKHGHWVVPYGGREGRLATNPISLSAPSDGPHPIVLDMSTAMIAEGKIRSMMYQEKSVPAGFIQDSTGKQITDPSLFYGPPKGTILPLGSPFHGYKGFGLSLFAEIFAGILGGNASSEDLPYINGLCLVAIDPDAFAGRDTFKHLIAEMTGYMKSSLPSPGFDEIVMPGELDFTTYDTRLKDGIPVSESVWDMIVHTAQKVGADIIREY